MAANSRVAGGRWAIGGVDLGEGAGAALGQVHRIAHGDGPGLHAAGVAAVIGGVLADDVLDGKAKVQLIGASGGNRGGLKDLEDGGAGVPVHGGRALYHVIALERGNGHDGGIGNVQALGNFVEFGLDIAEDLLVIVHEVDLIHREDDVAHAQERGHVEVAAGLFDDAVAGIDKQHHHLRGGHAGDRIAGVLHVAGGIGEDEGALIGGEVAVGHVDGNTLLALGAQAIDQQG